MIFLRKSRVERETVLFISLLTEILMPPGIHSTKQQLVAKTRVYANYMQNVQQKISFPLSELADTNL